MISVLTLPSTLINRCITIDLVSLFVRAYRSLFLINTIKGKHSRCLCGPEDGFGAQVPVSLSSIQCFGAFNRFMCFFGPRVISVEFFGKDDLQMRIFLNSPSETVRAI